MIVKLHKYLLWGSKSEMDRFEAAAAGGCHGAQFMGCAHYYEGPADTTIA